MARRSAWVVVQEVLRENPKGLSANILQKIVKERYAYSCMSVLLSQMVREGKLKIIKGHACQNCGTKRGIYKLPE